MTVLSEVACEGGGSSMEYWGSGVGHDSVMRTKYAVGRCTRDTAQPVPHCIPLAIVGRVTVTFTDKRGPSVAKGQVRNSSHGFLQGEDRTNSSMNQLLLIPVLSGLMYLPTRVI